MRPDSGEPDEEELRRLPEGGRLEAGGATYFRLDSSRRRDISRCSHRWVQDAPGHWVCPGCGYGTYRPRPPAPAPARTGGTDQPAD